MVAREPLLNRYDRFVAPLTWFREATSRFPEPAPIRTYAYTYFFTRLTVLSGAKAFTFAQKKSRLRRRHLTHCRASQRKQKTANFRNDATVVGTTSNGTVLFTVPYCSKIVSIQWIVTVISLCDAVITNWFTSSRYVKGDWTVSL